MNAKEKEQLLLDLTPRDKPCFGPEIGDDEVCDLIRSVPEHFSANLVVDIGGTCVSLPSIAINAGTISTGQTSGLAYLASGGIVGQSVDLLAANTACNVNITGTPLFTSGQLRVQIQGSDTDTSGNYTDPTSGLAQLPSWFQSGGILILNSGGLLGGTRGAQTSGQSIQSGFNEFAYFQRPFRFVRANALSGDFYCGALSVSFVSQLKTTGSGAGFTLSPSSGSVVV